MFFGTLKSAMFYTPKSSSVSKPGKEISDYTNYYNIVRIRLNLKGKSLVQHETLSL
ncbi:IS3 family transposase [Marnyiella aurantia]|uniref:IS3 family transposase n=1 Tax=Marnyiella aurantia TaxID=2758037 RepID=A0A7D7LMJ2_9FLAO|nr:IS3 family transposase [Marnyiella aurantia]QMS98484.1 IS3 family transposase [Marnyiella aurantia]